MKEAYEYLGHSIDLNLTACRDRFGYTYFIDRQYCFECAASSLSVAEARADALGHAHRSIAALAAMRTALPHRMARPSTPVARVSEDCEGATDEEAHALA